MLTLLVLHITSRLQKVKMARLPALHTGRLYSQETSLVLISARGRVEYVPKKNTDGPVGNRASDLPSSIIGMRNINTVCRGSDYSFILNVVGTLRNFTYMDVRKKR